MHSRSYRAPGIVPRSPEVNEAAVLEPKLRETCTFRRCRKIARQLLGVPVGYQFDHAIYKAPYNQTSTEWHQDEAYNHEPIPLRSIHFWIPLQPATVENDRMQFIPGWHHSGMLSYRITNRRGAGGTMAVEGIDVSKAVAGPLAAGSATIHHPLTLHYTGPNQTSDYRRAWILHFGASAHMRHRLHPKSIAAKMHAWIPHIQTP